MDKKEFFESFVSLLPDNSGHRLDAFGEIQNVFASIKSDLTDCLRNEFEPIEWEVLSHIWMFEQICNGGMSEDTVPWPLIIISVSGEILFANKTYCQLSGLSPTDVQHHSADGTLFSRVYEWGDIGKAHGAISRLRAGKGYEHLELFMKYSGRRISWNSYGWVGESLEIRSWVEIRDENDQKKEHERFYRGYVMNTTRLLENIYHIVLHGTISRENEEKLAWIQEFLSMFDFLWNHSELFMEIIDIPTARKGRIQGWYNTVYAQFFQYSFQEEKKFKDILTRSHGDADTQFLETQNPEEIPSARELTFRWYDKIPSARIYWQYSICPHRVVPEYNRILGIGVLVRKIPRKNIITRMFRSIFQRSDTANI